MKFQFYQSSKILQPYVKGFLEADSTTDATGGKNALFPNGFSGIFFNFGPPGKLVLKQTSDTKPISIYGQIDRHFSVEHDAGFYSLGVLLKPTVLSTLLRVNAYEFTNTSVDGTLLRSDLKLLHEKIEYGHTIKQKIEIIEAYFIATLMILPTHNTITDHALDLIHNCDALSIEKLARNLNISQRYLEMNFKRTVGLSPKTYSLIIRFKRMEEQLKKITTARWHHMNFADGYHDQNHFIKDFKRFTGHTPSDYLIADFEMGKSYMAMR